MGLIDDAKAFISDDEYYGNTVTDYLIAVILFFGSYIVIWFTKTIILSKIKSWIDKRDLSEASEVLIEKIQKGVGKLIIFIVSLYIAAQPLSLTSSLNLTLDFILLVAISYYLLKIMYIGVDIAISLQQRTTTQMSANMNEFIRLVLKTILTIIVILWFLANLGIDTTAFLASLGIFALAIAFALQNVISDIFSALVIYIDKPIEIGDYIEIRGDIGQVEKIGIRSTRIRILTGHLLIVSNREIINSRIYNYKRMERRRVSFTLGLSLETPLELIKEVPGLIEDLFKDIENTSFDRVFLTTLNQFSYDFEIVYYVLSRSYSEYQSTHQKVNLSIISALDQKGIIIPYPTQFVYLQKIKTEEV